VSLVSITNEGLTNESRTYLDISQIETAKGSANRVPGALEIISAAIDQVAAYKAEWGAGQNRLQYTVANLMNVVEFTTAARSRIQDADFAVEAARLAKAQVLQQTGTAMLAQANAAPQLALQLLK
jgi:flagellin